MRLKNRRGRRCCATPISRRLTWCFLMLMEDGRNIWSNCKDWKRISNWSRTGPRARAPVGRKRWLRGLSPRERVTSEVGADKNSALLGEGTECRQEEKRQLCYGTPESGGAFAPEEVGGKADEEENDGGGEIHELGRVAEG